MKKRAKISKISKTPKIPYLFITCAAIICVFIIFNRNRNLTKIKNEYVFPTQLQRPRVIRQRNVGVEGAGTIRDTAAIPHESPYRYKPIWNKRTRGQPTEYQQVGYLTNCDGGAEGADCTRRPLFGRQTYGGSDLWNYYSVDNNGIRLRVINNEDPDRVCMKDRGCKEIDESGKVTIDDIEYDTNLYDPSTLL